MSEPLHGIQGSWPGQLSIVARPRGGEWLEDEVRSWARSGLEVIVSLLEPAEEAEFGLTHEGKLCRSMGIAFHSFPIEDRGVPASRDETLKLVRELEQYLAAGKSVGIHCRQGIGRSSLIAACLLVSAGETPNNAFKRLSRARGCEVPETVQQREWVEDFAPKISAARH
ncbi:MAG: protein-tyrosine phosphatase family protein [Nitrospiraceae bacterium]